MSKPEQVKAEAETSGTVTSVLASGFMRDPRFACDFGDEVMSVTHLETGERFLLEWRLMPLGRDSGDG